jgi:hypothetical protein
MPRQDPSRDGVVEDLGPKASIGGLDDGSVIVQQGGEVIDGDPGTLWMLCPRTFGRLSGLCLSNMRTNMRTCRRGRLRRHRGQCRRG